MTTVQKIALRLSKVRSRLNQISQLEDDAFTDEIRNEGDALQVEFRNLESRHQASLIAEGETEARRSGEFANEGDSEARERATLLRETRICDYMGPAANGSGIEGRSRELNAALGVPVAGREGGPAVPWGENSLWSKSAQFTRFNMLRRS